MAKRKAPMGPAEGGAAGGAGAATTSTAGAELSVSNLPVTYGEDDVRALFSRCGEVRAVHMAIDQLSGSPSGVATVVLGSSASASNAQQLLHKASADGEGGKLLNVWKAANSAEPDATEDRTALYMRGVPPAWGDAELRTFLSQHGALEGVKKLPQRNPDPNLVPAIGRFATRECAERTLQAINGTSLQNESDSGPESTVLQVRFADSQNAKRHKQSAVRRDDAHFGAVAAPATAVPPLLAQQQQQQQAQQFPNVVGGFTNTAQPPPPNSRAPNQAPSAASNGYMVRPTPLYMMNPSFSSLFALLLCVIHRFLICLHTTSTICYQDINILCCLHFCLVPLSFLMPSFQASSTSAPPAPPAPAANAPPPPTAPQGTVLCLCDVCVACST